MSPKKKAMPKSALPASLAEDAGAPASPAEMSPDVIEFITAIDNYKRKHSRPFPSWSEVLDVLRSLGYQRASR